MKKIIVSLLFLAPSLVCAQEGMLNFNEIFKATRVGVFLDQHANRMTGIYSTLLGFHGSSGVEYVNLNIGYLKRIDDSKKDSPLVQVGFRMDNLFAKARSSNWAQRHTSMSPLPAIEFGPYISLWVNREDGHIKTDMLYGIGLAIRL